MRHDDDRLPERIAQREEQFVDLFLIFGVEVAGRLVGQQYGGRVDQCAGDGYALLFAPRQFGGFMGQTVFHGQHPEQFGGPFFDFVPFASGDVARNTHVLERGKLGQQVVELEYEADLRVAEFRDVLVRQRMHGHAVDLDLAGSGPAQRAEDLQQRRFAGAARPDDRNDFPFVDRQVDSFEHFERTETFVYIFGFYHGFAVFAAVKRFHSAMTCAASRTSCTRRIEAPWRRHSQCSAEVPVSASSGVVSSVR